VIVPPAAGVGSALGLLEGNETFELARTALMRLDHPEAPTRASELLASLEQDALAMVGEPWRADAAVHRTAGLRYAGQGYELEVPLDGDASLSTLASTFNEHYERAYGYREQLPVEAVTWYLTLVRPPRERRVVVPNAPGSELSKGTREAYFPETGLVDVPVVDRLALTPGATLKGPVLVEEPHTTTVVLPGDVVSVDDSLALLIDIGGRDDA